MIFLFFLLQFCIFKVGHSVFQQKKVIQFSENSIPETELQLLLDTKTLISQNALKDDCSDILFRDTEEKEVIHFVEFGCNTESTSFILEKNEVVRTTKKILMFYDNPEYSKSNWDEGFFISMSKSTCSGDWENFAESEGKFIKCGKPDNFGVVETAEQKHSHQVKDQSTKETTTDEDNERMSGDKLCTRQDHTHFYSFVTSESTNLPAYTKIGFCKSRFLDLPLTSVLLFSTAVGWNGNFSTIDTFEDTYPFGGDFTGAKIGANTHSHTFSGTTFGSNEAECEEEISYLGDEDVAANNHQHSYSGTFSEANHEPLFFSLTFGEPSDPIFLSGLSEKNIFMSNSVPIAGYTALDVKYWDRILKGNNQNPLSIGGESDHQHTYMTTAPRSLSENTVLETYGSSCARKTHTHEISGSADPTNNEVPSISVVFVQRNQIYTLSLDYSFSNATDTSNGNDITSNPAGTIAAVVITFLIFACCLIGIISAVIIVVIVVAYFREKEAKSNVVEVEIDNFIGGKTTGNEEETPKVQIDSKMFEIKHSDITLKSELGEGAGGVAYKALWKGKPVCFKMFSTRYLNNETNFQEFETEANLLSSLSHPNIISFFGCVIKGKIGIVMELANGDLKSLVERGKEIKYEKKLKILQGIVSGMVYLRDRKIIHRDLKTGNILLTKDLEPKITDFGLSRLLHENSQVTANKGTSIYMAPEVVKGEDYSFAADVFSFGIIMYELLCMNPYPYGTNLSFCVEQKVANNPHFRPKIDEEKYIEEKKYVEVMKTCWDHDQSKRYTWNKLDNLFSNGSLRI